MLIFLVILILLNGVYSTNVQGPIFTNTTWSQSKSPYILTGGYQVAIGVTLTILPNTTFIFNDDFQLLIKGKLVIKGSTVNPVRFLGNSRSSKAMILLKDINLSESSITNCHFHGPKSAINVGDQYATNVIKNIGNLHLNRIFLNHLRIQTSGYIATASVTINNVNITDSIVDGFSGVSDPIFIIVSQ